MAASVVRQIYHKNLTEGSTLSWGLSAKFISQLPSEMIQRA